MSDASSEARERIDEFVQHSGDRRLARHAALPAALNPDLLNLIRVNFLRDGPEPSPYAAEADLLLSPLCRALGGELYEMERGVRDLLLRELAAEEGPERIEAVAMLLGAYSESGQPWAGRRGLERAQRLTALSILDPHGADAWLRDAESAVGPAAGQEVSLDRAWYVAMRSEFERLQDAARPPEQEEVPGGNGLLTWEERRRLVELLLDIPGMHDITARRQLISNIPDVLQRLIPFDSSPFDHINRIIATLDSPGAQLADGTWPIMLVIENAIGMTAGSQLGEQLASLRAAVEQRISPPQPDDVPDFGDLDSVDALQAILNDILENLRQLKNVLDISAAPVAARLSRVARVQNRSDALRTALRQMSPQSGGLNLLGVQEATAWLNTAHKMAESAGDALQRCYRNIDTLLSRTSSGRTYQLRLRDASQNLATAINHYESLLSHVDNLLARNARSGKSGVHTGQARLANDLTSLRESTTSASPLARPLQRIRSALEASERESEETLWRSIAESIHSIYQQLDSWGHLLESIRGPNSRTVQEIAVGMNELDIALRDLDIWLGVRAARRWVVLQQELHEAQRSHWSPKAKAALSVYMQWLNSERSAKATARTLEWYVGQGMIAGDNITAFGKALQMAVNLAEQQALEMPAASTPTEGAESTTQESRSKRRRRIPPS